MKRRLGPGMVAPSVLGLFVPDVAVVEMAEYPWSLAAAAAAAAELTTGDADTRISLGIGARVIAECL